MKKLIIAIAIVCMFASTAFALGGPTFAKSERHFAVMVQMYDNMVTPEKLGTDMVNYLYKLDTRDLAYLFEYTEMVREATNNTNLQSLATTVNKLTYQIYNAKRG